MNTGGRQPIAGGEILDHIGQGASRAVEFVDWNLMQQYTSIPLVRGLIVFLILAIFILLVFRIMNIKSMFKDKGITMELKNISAIKQRDEMIILTNKILSKMTRIIQRTPFNIGRGERDYFEYNIKRAGLKVPGGYRNVTPEEFNAINKLIAATVITIGIITAIFINLILGVVIICTTVIIVGAMANFIVRGIVKEKDREIKENFADLYLMIHYVLLSGGDTPIDRVLKSYIKTTRSKEMVEFVDNCCGLIDTYGEYGALHYISKDYREIAEVGKLTRLIKQLHDGGDVEEDLIGFRDELIKEKRYRLEKRMEKTVSKARKSFIMLTVILIQAILTAMALYLPDLGVFGDLF